MSRKLEGMEAESKCETENCEKEDKPRWFAALLKTMTRVISERTAVVDLN